MSSRARLDTILKSTNVTGVMERQDYGWLPQNFIGMLKEQTSLLQHGTEENRVNAMKEAQRLAAPFFKGSRSGLQSNDFDRYCETLEQRASILKEDVKPTNQSVGNLLDELAVGIRKRGPNVGWNRVAFVKLVDRSIKAWFRAIKDKSNPLVEMTSKEIEDQCSALYQTFEHSLRDIMQRGNTAMLLPEQVTLQDFYNIVGRIEALGNHAAQQEQMIRTAFQEHHLNPDAVTETGNHKYQKDAMAQLSTILRNAVARGLGITEGEARAVAPDDYARNVDEMLHSGRQASPLGRIYVEQEHCGITRLPYDPERARIAGKVTVTPGDGTVEGFADPKPQPVLPIRRFEKVRFGETEGLSPQWARTHVNDDVPIGDLGFGAEQEIGAAAGGHCVAIPDIPPYPVELNTETVVEESHTGNDQGKSETSVSATPPVHLKTANVDRGVKQRLLNGTRIPSNVPDGLEIHGLPASKAHQPASIKQEDPYNRKKGRRGEVKDSRAGVEPPVKSGSADEVASTNADSEKAVTEEIAYKSSAASEDNVPSVDLADAEPVQQPGRKVSAMKAFHSGLMASTSVPSDAIVSGVQKKSKTLPAEKSWHKEVKGHHHHITGFQPSQR